MEKRFIKPSQKKFYSKSMERAMTDINVMNSLIDRIDQTKLDSEDVMKISAIKFKLNEVPVEPPKIFKLNRENDAYIKNLLDKYSK
jgi:hypothetical protein